MRPSPQERLEELDEGEDAEEEQVPPGEGGRCVGAARPVLHGGGALSIKKDVQRGRHGREGGRGAGVVACVLLVRRGDGQSGDQGFLRDLRQRRLLHARPGALGDAVVLMVPEDIVGRV